jgi:hypothetical protein
MVIGRRTPPLLHALLPDGLQARGRAGNDSRTHRTDPAGPRYPLLRELAVSGDFEAVLSFGLGLWAVAGLTVTIPTTSAASSSTSGATPRARCCGR